MNKSEEKANNICGKKCDYGSECLEPSGHEPADRHETQHGCVFYDTQENVKAMRHEWARERAWDLCESLGIEGDESALDLVYEFIETRQAAVDRLQTESKQRIKHLEIERDSIREQTLEEAAKVECYLCRNNTPFRDFNMVPGAMWHVNPDNDKVLTRCEAERIRTLMKDFSK